MWTKNSWKSKKALQSVHYEDQKKLDETLVRLENWPPLITEFEVKKLRKLLSDAEQGKAFVLQGGDCSEQFGDCTPAVIENKFKILLQMSVILIHSLKKPIIRVGRIAGQYAKPRSADRETQGGLTLPSYRGDIINGPQFTKAARTPDPKRMEDAYFYSALTLNYLRGLSGGGFADLHQPELWKLQFMHGAASEAYEAVLRSITDSIHFFESIAGMNHDALSQVSLYTSHEALHLPYEAALTRQAQDGLFYNLGTHFPWVGMRTLQRDGAHIEYLRGIANPIGIKVGPTADLDELCKIIEILNPKHESGKIMLIHRLGREQVEAKLPLLLKCIKAEGFPVLWSCDPMHGNTKTTQSGIKTRYFEDIVSELTLAFEIHERLKINLGAIHFEMTGENVTECIGGASGLSEEDLVRDYKSLVDPRLNYEQAMEIALKIKPLAAPFFL